MKYICKECDPPCILDIGESVGDGIMLAIAPATCPYERTDTETHNPHWVKA